MFLHVWWCWSQLMVSDTAHCKGFGTETLFCFAFLEVLLKEGKDRTEIYRLYRYFNNSWLVSWVSQIFLSSQIYFTDINHDSDAQLEEKDNPKCANKWPCSRSGPTFEHKHDLSFGQMCSYWHVSPTQVVGRSWGCTFLLFQSGCPSIDRDLHKSMKKKFTRAYLKGCLVVNSSTERRNGSRICLLGTDI